MVDSLPLLEVAKRSQLRNGVPLRAKASETPVLLIRDGDAVHAYQAECPHAGAPLEHGAVCRGRLVCPWHKATFDVSTGALLEPPALRGLKRYRVELRGDDVLVSTDAPTPAPAAEQAADAGDAKLIATGSVPKPPPVRGIDDTAVRPRVVMLRNLDDAARLDALAAAGDRAVVIGSSFIGLEVASALRKRGVQVTVVSPDPVPFAKQFGHETGELFLQLHRQNGTAFETETQVDAIEAGEPLTVCTKNGKRIACDFAVAGTGVASATGFVEGVKRNNDGGLNVDASMRVGNAGDGLFAAGDIACFEAPGGTRIRIEHWRVAQQQARAAARGMPGIDAQQPSVPFFWTYHYGKRFDYLGHARAGDWDTCETIGSPAQYAFVTLYGRNGTVVAALGCQRETPIARLAEAMREPLSTGDARRIVDPASTGRAP